MPRTGRTPTAQQLARVMDNQGRIDILPRKTIVTPMLLVKSMEHELIEWLLHFGGHEHEKGKVPDDDLLTNPDPNRVRRWAWRSQNDEAVQIVEAIRPWLKIEQKQLQADLVLMTKVNEYGERRVELNADITAEMEHIHRTGGPSGRLERRLARFKSNR